MNNISILRTLKFRFWTMILMNKWILRSSEAKMAAAEMNQTYIARGAQQAIVVKFADTPKEKEKRKLERQVRI